jgi:hypothetical protein
MNSETAKTVRMGDMVTYRGQAYRVTSIKTKGMAAPYFRLRSIRAGLPDEDLTSYELCSIPKRTHLRTYAVTADGLDPINEGWER